MAVRTPRRPASPPPADPPEEETPEGDEETGDEDQGDEETDEESSEEGAGGNRGFRPLANVSPVQDGSGAVLGILTYFVLVNYLKGGVPQVKQWFAAKFLNKTTATTNAKGQSAAPPSGNGSTSAPQPPSGMGLA